MKVTLLIRLPLTEARAYSAVAQPTVPRSLAVPGTLTIGFSGSAAAAGWVSVVLAVSCAETLCAPLSVPGFVVPQAPGTLPGGRKSTSCAAERRTTSSGSPRLCS